MSDYIDRQKVMKLIADDIVRSAEPCNGDYIIGLSHAQTLIEVMPAADVVEVVRCKDCKWGREACGNIECFVDINVPPEYHGYEWFCPNGERRTDGRPY